MNASDNDRPGAGLLWRSITPSQAAAIAAARANGVRAQLLAREYGVSVRTIYRAIAYARQPWVVVHVGTWHAEFVVTEDGPARMTAWLASVDA